MNVSDQGLHLIQVFEHCRLTPYTDSDGIWTIAWGHALTSPDGQMITDGADVSGAMQRLFGTSTSCTQAQADALLRTDLAPREATVNAHANSPTQSQFDAMVSLVFNIGAGNYRNSSVLRLHNDNDRTVSFDLNTLSMEAKAHSLTAPKTMAQAFAAWSYGDHQYVLGLFRRRMCEAMVYRGDDVDSAYNQVEQFG